jgi:hypothetical protein
VDIRKATLFFAIAFLLFAVDLGCTYTTFAVLAVPIEFEVNRVFREWVVRDGWLVSIGKFTVLKTFLFLFAAWMIFRTRDRVATFILAQCIVSNHLVAISSHPTLWWMENLEHRALLLKAIAGVSLVLTFYGIRYLRSRPRESKPLGRIDLPICSQNL